MIYFWIYWAISAIFGWASLILKHKKNMVIKDYGKVVRFFLVIYFISPLWIPIGIVLDTYRFIKEEGNND